MLVCQGRISLGNGVNDLDGSGGEFECTMTLGGQTVQPDPQLVWFSTATRSAIFTEQFPIYIGETVTIKIKSPNAADSSVYVRACIIEVGVESIRDDLAVILLNQRIVLNVWDESEHAGGTAAARGVIPQIEGTGEGVYPRR